MSLSIDDQLTLVEVLCLFLGIGITWAVYYGSENAELPGEAQNPDPRGEPEISRFSEGRSLR
ncbi:MAG: hypothetical protein ACYDFT_06525 [Thermoplasmata archaeon]